MKNEKNVVNTHTDLEPNNESASSEKKSQKKRTVTKKASAEPSATPEKKKRTKSTKAKAQTQEEAAKAHRDSEIGNDLYALYVENFSNSKELTPSIDVFDVIEEDETSSNETIKPNTSYLDGDESEQITFSDIVPDSEEDEGDDNSDKADVDTLPPYNEKKPRHIDGRFDFMEMFIFTLLAVMILTSFIFRHSIVDGDSMLNTLHDGEHLIISDVFYTPKQGDIIICEDYSTGIRKPIVKRVIAVGGDNLQISANGTVRVNGKILPEEYVFLDGRAYYPPIDIVIPEGELYVMGDHRNASTDSRQVGCIDEDAVLGKVLLRFYPFEKFGTVD